MCYYIKLDGSEKQKIEERFDAAFERKDLDWPQGRINGFSRPHTPVIIDSSPKELILMRWGFEPFWANGKAFLNSRIEKAEMTNPFKKYTCQRCIIPVSGFYEWQYENAAGRKTPIKHPFIITPPDAKFMALAGIYDDQGNYVIMTTEANELMATIHNSKKRMPVVLKREEEKLWLSGEPLSLYGSRKEVELVAEPL